ncbi:MFS general substrate transporter [Backusella circina FSU 941]|nr:MFS general substrate transporter [Backusella circina FSU 941]
MSHTTATSNNHTPSNSLKEGAVEKEEVLTAYSDPSIGGDVEKELSNQESLVPPTEEHDGGYGWLVVFGAFFVQITGFGTITSWGVMQDYYHQHVFDNTPQTLVQLSFVGTLALIFTNGMSPIIQMIVSIVGLRPVIIAGTVFVTLALELASLSNQIWHLYLTQGVLFGIGTSCLYITVMGVTPQWFTKRRGMALGIVAGGSGIGGLVIPFILTKINSTLGPAWTYRIMGFVCLGCDLVACIFVKERVPSNKHRKKFSQLINFSVLKNTDFLLFLIGSDVSLFGYFVPFFFLPTNATYLGLSASQGSGLIAVGSACNFIGRIIVGIMADYIGKLNANLCFVLLASISNFLIWTFANSYGTLMAFAAIFGLSCGSYFALMSPISAHILGMEKFPSGLSLLLMSNIIPVFGSNIASAIEAGVSSTPFLSYKMFAGTAYLAGFLILFGLKLKLNRNPFAKI